jgi:trehalose synthase
LKKILDKLIAEKTKREGIMHTNQYIVHVEDYLPLVGEEVVERVKQKAEKIKHLHVTHVNSTFYGGGVATLLGSLSLLMNSLGIMCGWRVIQGSPDYFSVTKKIHNALQGGDFNMTELKKKIFEEVVYENAVRNHLQHHDRVIIHDPQPLPMIQHYPARSPWIWRCHIDLTNPHPILWEYLVQFIDQYDAVIFTLKEYAQELKTPQVYFMPAIDPFTIKNRELSEDDVDQRLEHYGIPTDLPIITQISRFDKWKDPQGVIKAFNLARKEVDATLVLLGNIATDDPEGEEIYQSLLECKEERIRIISAEDTALVNALQKRAAVVLQKSLREGFGLTVAEAMWKGTPVIGGNVGGIRYQIKDGENGFLVDNIEQTAERIIQLIQDRDLGKRLGERGRETVRENFLMIRLVEQYLDLLDAFELEYTFKGI